MEFSQIKYFIMAAQTQNISKAAHILNITQPALSKSISNLEDELGALLFDRFGKRVTLNENGKKFLGHAINSVQELDNAMTAVYTHDERPMLYLGLFQSSGKFMQCLEKYSEAYPNVVVQADILDIASFSIDTNKYDMLLFPQIPFFRKYRADLVYSDTYFLAAHKDNPLTLNTAVRIKDLHTQRIVFIKHGDNMFDLPHQLCISLGIHLDYSIFTNSYEVQRRLISSNYGIGFIPRDGSESHAVDPNIALLPILDDGLNREIMIGFKREKHLCDVGKQFVEFVRDYFCI